jgi:hypothetical protein
MLQRGLLKKWEQRGRLRQAIRNPDGPFNEQIYSKPLADHHEGFDLMKQINRRKRI